MNYLMTRSPFFADHEDHNRIDELLPWNVIDDARAENTDALRDLLTRHFARTLPCSLTNFTTAGKFRISTRATIR
ncbi:hypothetical protein K788_0002468 [Paraburkholderia caribensis MBA4]|uniref:Uncharacterized protein n=1 Tax=Paraburkholderia caribensis MBA4 TaxID=1323664 RepID=A0A0P0R9P6_9BURK|nr:hypothetical protein [Paraburkholderia caribensis]ALL64963.1 hypothetical protein K788_0002468 [Paraburkholderia caribensis MBA4]